MWGKEGQGGRLKKDESRTADRGTKHAEKKVLFKDNALRIADRGPKKKTVVVEGKKAVRSFLSKTGEEAVKVTRLQI
jgi:hypothetical protein